MKHTNNGAFETHRGLKWHQLQSVSNVHKSSQLSQPADPKFGQTERAQGDQTLRKKKAIPRRGRSCVRSYTTSKALYELLCLENFEPSQILQSAFRVLRARAVGEVQKPCLYPYILHSRLYPWDVLSRCQVINAPEFGQV